MFIGMQLSPIGFIVQAAVEMLQHAQKSLFHGAPGLLEAKFGSLLRQKLPHCSRAMAMEDMFSIPPKLKPLQWITCTLIAVGLVLPLLVAIPEVSPIRKEIICLSCVMLFAGTIARMRLERCRMDLLKASSKSVLESGLSTKTQKTCLCCLEDFQAKTRVAVLPCGHVFDEDSSRRGTSSQTPKRPKIFKPQRPAQTRAVERASLSSQGPEESVGNVLHAAVRRQSAEFASNRSNAPGAVPERFSGMSLKSFGMSMELMDLSFSNKMQLGPDGQYVQQYTPNRGAEDEVYREQEDALSAGSVLDVFACEDLALVCPLAGEIFNLGNIDTRTESESRYMSKHGDMNQWDATAQDGADTRPGFHLEGFAAANADGTGATWIRLDPLGSAWGFLASLSCDRTCPKRRSAGTLQSVAEEDENKSTPTKQLALHCGSCLVIVAVSKTPPLLRRGVTVNIGEPGNLQI
eukprot:Skav207515  [mRNA]  locus=scaffold907:162465:185244:+ [translate_table: standard]